MGLSEPSKAEVSTFSSSLTSTIFTSSSILPSKPSPPQSSLGPRSYLPISSVPQYKPTPLNKLNVLKKMPLPSLVTRTSSLAKKKYIPYDPTKVIAKPDVISPFSSLSKNDDEESDCSAKFSDDDDQENSICKSSLSSAKITTCTKVSSSQERKRTETLNMFLSLIGKGNISQSLVTSKATSPNVPFSLESLNSISNCSMSSKPSDNLTNSGLPPSNSPHLSSEEPSQNAHLETSTPTCKISEVSEQSLKDTSRIVQHKQLDNGLPSEKQNQDELLKERDTIIKGSEENIGTQQVDDATSLKNNELIDATVATSQIDQKSAKPRGQPDTLSKVIEPATSKDCTMETKNEVTKDSQVTLKSCASSLEQDNDSQRTSVTLKINQQLDATLKNEESKDAIDNDDLKQIRPEIKNNEHSSTSFKDKESKSSKALEVKKVTDTSKDNDHPNNITKEKHYTSFKEHDLKHTKELSNHEEHKPMKKKDERAIKLVEKIKKVSVKFKESRTTSIHLNKIESSKIENINSEMEKKNKAESSESINTSSNLSTDKKLPSTDSELLSIGHLTDTKVQVKTSPSSSKEKDTSEKSNKLVSLDKKKLSSSNMKEKPNSENLLKASNKNKHLENDKNHEKKMHFSKSISKSKNGSPSSPNKLNDKKHTEPDKHAERERQSSKDSSKSEKLKPSHSKEKHKEKKDVPEYSKHHSSSSDKAKSSHQSKHHHVQKNLSSSPSPNKRDKDDRHNKVSISQSKHKHSLKKHQDSISQEEAIPCKRRKSNTIVPDKDSIHEPFPFDTEDKLEEKDKSGLFKNGMSEKSISPEFEQIIDELGDIDSDETLKQCWEIFNEEEFEFQEEEVPFKKAKIEIPDEPSKKKRQAHQPNLKRDNVLVKQPVRLTAVQMMQQRLLQATQAANKNSFEENKITKNNAFIQSLRPPGAERKRIQGANPNIHLLTALNKKLQQQSLLSASSLPNDLNPNITSSKSHSKGTRRIAHVPLQSTKPRPTVQVDSNSKVPYNTRQRYLGSMIDECLKFCHTEDEAYQMALEEEKGAYARSNNRAIYLSVSCNIINKLRRRHSDENGVKVPSTNDVNLGGAQAARTSFSIERKPSRVPTEIEGALLYKLLKPYLLTTQQMEENNYPVPHPTERGWVTYPNLKISPNSNSLERTCCRCQKRYLVDKKGQYVRQEDCIYHWGKLWKKKIAGSWESRYSCCQSDSESSGCCIAPGHVHDTLEERHLRGYVTTMVKSKDKGEDNEKDFGVYGLDCEMCYTTEGMELIRVSLVNSRCQEVFETLVKPENPILDANTRFSGLKESDLQNIATRLHQVQAVLLNLLDARSILIGHSLESDLRALRLCHSRIVDTSIVFPHRLGLPYKRSLRALMADHLNKIIQNDLDGHDSKEDACAAMQLMLYKVKDDARRAFR